MTSTNTKLIERRLSLARSGLSQSLSFGPEAPVTELTQADLNAISKILHQRKSLSQRLSLTLSIPQEEAPKSDLSALVTALDEEVDLPPRLSDAEVAKIKVTGPNGTVEPYTIVDDPSAWYAKDFEGNDEYIYTLTADEIAELDVALAHIEARDIPIQDISQADFPLPNLGAKMEALGAATFLGRGFQVVRGLPVDRWTKKQSITVYWGIASYWGEARCQSRKGAMMDHVKAAIPVKPVAEADPGRPQHSPVAHSYHTDSADSVALLCLAQAPEGGVSSWASSTTVHNELLKRGRADLVKVLTEAAWPRDRRGDLAPGGVEGQQWFDHPVFSYAAGYLTTVYAPHLIKMSQRWPDAPRLTPLQLEALKMVTALAGSDELCMRMKLQPGDIQLCYNHTMLHARSTYKDGPGKGEQRHLARLWVAPRTDRPMPEEYANFTGSTEPGNRGGIVCAPGTRPHVPLDKY